MEARQMVQTEEARRSIADRSYVAALIDKWKDFLEGVPDRTDQARYTLGVTAMLMENQSQYLQGLNEETKMVNVGAFTKFIFPVLRRVFPNLIANEIVSVQPMTAPVGAVFYLDYVYGTTKGGTRGQDQYPWTGAASGTGGGSRWTDNSYPPGGSYASQPPYGVSNGPNIFPRDFDKDYSSEFVNGEVMSAGANTLGFTPVRPPDTLRGFSVTIVEADATGTAVKTYTSQTDGSFRDQAAATPGGMTINYATGAVAAVPAATGQNTLKAYYFYDGEMNTRIPTINLDVKKVPVEAIPRRLKALWSSEAAEDLRAFHGLDAETEIVSATAQEIALEIDREIIQDLYQASTGTTASFNRVPPAAISELDHLRGMVTQIANVSNLIHKKTLRAPANFIVTSPEVSALFAQLTTHGDFRPLWSSDTASPYGPADAPRPLTQHGQFGIYKVGTLMNKWLVYEDPFFARDGMLIGLKGGSFLDAGYVWAPYVPLQVTPTFLDPADFSFRKGLRTRYAKKLLRSEFYGQMKITNL